MPDWFTVVGNVEDAEDVHDDVLPLRDLEYTQLDWVTEISLPGLLSILRGEGPLDSKGFDDLEGRERFNRVHAEFDMVLDDENDLCYCAIVPAELVERVAGLSPDASKEAMQAWGNTKVMRFEGKDWSDETYWSEMEEIFTELQRLCRLAQDEETGIFIYGIA